MYAIRSYGKAAQALVVLLLHVRTGAPGQCKNKISHRTHFLRSEMSGAGQDEASMIVVMVQLDPSSINRPGRESPVTTKLSLRAVVARQELA